MKAAVASPPLPWAAIAPQYARNNPRMTLDEFAAAHNIKLGRRLWKKLAPHYHDDIPAPVGTACWWAHLLDLVHPGTYRPRRWTDITRIPDRLDLRQILALCTTTDPDDDMIGGLYRVAGDRLPTRPSTRQWLALLDSQDPTGRLLR